MKKLISKALTLAMVLSSLAIPAKAEANNGTVLFNSNLDSADMVSISSPADANRVFQWYGKDGAKILDSNKGLSSWGSNYTAAWEVPQDFDPEQDWTLECTWVKKGGCEFMIYSEGEDGKLCYERYLGLAGNNTIGIQIKYENGVIYRKRTVDAEYGAATFSGGTSTQKLLGIGIRQTEDKDTYIDNIVLKQGDKTWTEDFENKSASEFQNMDLKLSDYFYPRAKFVETGATGTGDKKLYIPAKGTNAGAWSYLKLPTITNGVYELSMEYQVGRKGNDYLYIGHESGDGESTNYTNKPEYGAISNLKITIDKDNDKITLTWLNADGTEFSSQEMAITNQTPITNIQFRMHNTGTLGAWIDDVKLTRISGSEEYTPTIFGEQILTKVDFENMSKSFADLGFTSSGSSAYVGGKNGAGFSPALTSGDFSYNDRFMAYLFSQLNNANALGDGTYHVRFALNSYDNASQNAIYLANGDVSNAYKSEILSTDTLNSYANQWVDVDIKFEIPSLKWTATVTPEEGEAYTNSGTYTHPDNIIPALQWWVKPTSNFKTTVAPAIDNFYITKELENTDLTDEALLIVDGEGNQYKNKNVPTEGLLLVLDFGTQEAIDAVSKDNIKLLKNGTEIDYNGSKDNTMWVVEPGRLEYDTTYAISVEAGIPDGQGAYITPRTFAFTTEREVQIPDNNILGDVDFEDWTVETLKANYASDDTTPGDGFTVWSNSGFVAGPDGKGQAAPMYMSAAAARSMQFWPVGGMKNATYYAEFDYKLGEQYTVNKFYVDRGTPALKDVQPQDIITTDEMKSFGTGWVKVRFELINPSNVWSVKVTNTLGETLLEKTGQYPGPTQVLTHLGWSYTRNSGATIDQVAAVDNFLMWLEYDKAPELTKDSVKIYEGETVQTMWRVSPDADKITVDFGQRMKASDIEAITDNVYIVDKATNTKIALTAADYAYDSGIVTISLENAGLGLGKAYKLHVNQMSNIASMQMEKAYDFDFKVAADALKVRFTGVSQNDTAVSEGTKLAAGEAKVSLAWNNGTDKAKTLYVITAGYAENGMLESVTYTPIEAPADGQDKTEDVTVTVPEADRTTFMIWDGFMSMNPLADTLNF